MTGQCSERDSKTRVSKVPGEYLEPTGVGWPVAVHVWNCLTLRQEGHGLLVFGI